VSGQLVWRLDYHHYEQENGMAENLRFEVAGKAKMAGHAGILKKMTKHRPTMNFFFEIFVTFQLSVLFHSPLEWLVAVRKVSKMRMMARYRVEVLGAIIGVSRGKVHVMFGKR
jgi:hypothetical protein